MNPQRSKLRLIIVFIAIALLVVVGVSIAASIANSKKAKDMERQADIAALSKGVESYLQEYDAYPTFEQLSDSTYTEQYMADVKAAAFVDPDANPVTNSGDGYVYKPTPAGCDNIDVYCLGYTLQATLSDGTVIVEKN